MELLVAPYTSTANTAVRLQKLPQGREESTTQMGKKSTIVIVLKLEAQLSVFNTVECAQTFCTKLLLINACYRRLALTL